MNHANQNVLAIKPEPKSPAESGAEEESDKACLSKANVKTESSVSDPKIELEYPFRDLPIEFESKTDSVNKGEIINVKCENSVSSETKNNSIYPHTYTVNLESGSLAECGDVREKVGQHRTNINIYLADMKQECLKYTMNGDYHTDNINEDPLERKRRQARERTRRYRERLCQNSKAVFDEEQRRKQEEEARARRVSNALAQARKRARETLSEAQARRSANALAQARKRAREAQARCPEDAPSRDRKFSRQTTREAEARNARSQAHRQSL